MYLLSKKILETNNFKSNLLVYLHSIHKSYILNVLNKRCQTVKFTSNGHTKSTKLTFKPIYTVKLEYFAAIKFCDFCLSIIL